MNTSIYLVLDGLTMSLVAAMEFVGTIGIALFGAQTIRKLVEGRPIADRSHRLSDNTLIRSASCIDAQSTHQLPLRDDADSVEEV